MHVMYIKHLEDSICALENMILCAIVLLVDLKWPNLFAENLKSKCIAKIIKIYNIYKFIIHNF